MHLLRKEIDSKSQYVLFRWKQLQVSNGCRRTAARDLWVLAKNLKAPNYRSFTSRHQPWHTNDRGPLAWVPQFSSSPFLHPSHQPNVHLLGWTPCA